MPTVNQIENNYVRQGNADGLFPKNTHNFLIKMGSLLDSQAMNGNRALAHLFVLTLNPIFEIDFSVPHQKKIIRLH